MTTQSLTLLTAIFLSVVVANAIEAAPEPVRVFIIDDQTGEELRTTHGIQPLQVDDLLNLLNEAIMGTTPVYLFHQIVDEDATDNAVSHLVYSPFTGGTKPTMPEGQIPLHQYAMVKKSFDKLRAKWQYEIRGYQRGLVANTESFIQRVVWMQAETAQRFDDVLEARNGRDFNRSDIVGSLVAANKILGTSGRRILVLNTDAADLPGSRKPQKSPLIANQLDPGIELIFVNMSRLPEQSILFTGLSNPVTHADSMKEAMTLIAAKLNQREMQNITLNQTTSPTQP